MTELIFEISHAIENIGLQYDDECFTELASGLCIATPAYPNKCEYLRVITPKGYELMYWHFNEWEENGAEVMGSIIGLLQYTSEDIKDIEVQIIKQNLTND